MSRSPLAELAQDYWETRMRVDPLRATYIKYPRYHDRLDDNTPSGREAARRDFAALLKRSRAINRRSLTAAQAATLDTLRFELEQLIEGYALGFRSGSNHLFWEWQVDHMDGPETTIGTVVELAQPMSNDADARALLARMAAVPAYFDNHIADLKRGLAAGKVSARVPVEKAIAQLGDLLKTPVEKSPFAAAAGRLPKSARKKRRPQILEATAGQVYPSYRRYRNFLKTELLPQTRTKRIGLGNLPQGAKTYRYAIGFHTTLDATPEKLHAVGLAQLAAIEGEMKKIARRAGHAGSVRSFLHAVRDNPKNFFSTRAEILGKTNALVDAIKARLPEVFGVLPKTSMEVRPCEPHKEKNDVAARYYPPPEDFSRPGIYSINTYKPGTRPRFTMAALAAHEAVPGHHLQLALALERESLPAFRRNSLSTAFVEGWALYAERLADEMGFYADDLSRLGMLTLQAWRAARLVLDTGLHAKSWSRRKAIDFLKAHSPLSEHEIEAEVDRYTIWPGQALAYMVGQLEIMDLREASRRALGARFDLRKFHDQVLGTGAVPLKVLRSGILRRRS